MSCESAGADPQCDSIPAFKAPPDAAQQNARDIIDRQVKHLIRLVDDLLDISRISSGKISLQKERVSLALIVTNAIKRRAR